MHVPNLVQFLSDLSRNNQRPWFIMNKPRYDILREEFLLSVSHLITLIGIFDPKIQQCDPKKSLFRIYRDARFTRDGKPYKTTFSASLLPNGRKKPSEGGGPAYYFQINEHGTLLCAVGEYSPPSDRLRTIRQNIVDDAKGFSKILNDKILHKSFGILQEEGKLTRPPKGFKPDDPHIEYLKLKHFIVWKEWPLLPHPPQNIAQFLATHFESAYPLVHWLRKSTDA